MASPPKARVSVWSAAKVFALLIEAVSVDTFSTVSGVVVSSSSAMLVGAAASDSIGRSRSSVMVTG